jgi:hypothetical protein
MKQIIYAMQFKGKAAPTANPKVMKAATSSPSTSISSVCNAEGVKGNVGAIAGDKAEFESEVTLTGATSFLETGTIRFGSGKNLVRFSTVGEGYLGSSPEAKLSSGAVIWKIDSGEGQFAGASGYITSNFTLSDTGDVIDNQFGLIFVR